MAAAAPSDRQGLEGRAPPGLLDDSRLEPADDQECDRCEHGAPGEGFATEPGLRDRRRTRSAAGNPTATKAAKVEAAARSGF